MVKLYKLAAMHARYLLYIEWVKISVIKLYNVFFLKKEPK